MALKITFLGSGSAFTLSPENYHSNILLQIDNDSLLIDAGSDLRHSLHELNLGHEDIKNVYISHLHSDHAGGLEWLALISHFETPDKERPRLYVAKSISHDLWNKTLAGGLSTLRDEKPCIDSFFEVHRVDDNGSFVWHSITFQLIRTVHFFSNYELMPSFGLMFHYHNTCILFTSDSQYTPEYFIEAYEKADVIFHDCETSAHKSSVHAHYSELKQLPLAIKQKMWLYHYNPGSLPDAKRDGFLGFVAKGQQFLF